jgi:hypothetical protein
MWSTVGKFLQMMIVNLAIGAIPYLSKLLQNFVLRMLPEIFTAAINKTERDKCKADVIASWEQYITDCQAQAAATPTPIDNWVFAALKVAGPMEDSELSKIIDAVYAEVDKVFFPVAPVIHP